MAKKLKDFKPKMCSDCGKTPCACMSEARLDEGRPSQRHPLEGHEYHKKSDAALIHIAKDAHAAAEAMKSHNTAAENKYRDQANDSATVRHFRKTNGMPTWYKKKYGHSTNEEIEQVDELDRSGTLTRYIDKTRGDPERKAGNALALKKKWGDKNYGLEEPKVKGMDRNEEVEQVDEKASDKEVKMATGIPHDKRYVGGNMTGAISAIEKIRKDLSKHPRVTASLKAANEEVERINEKLETETIKHPKGERPKGIGWVLKSAGEQTGKDHSVWERKFKRVGGVKEEVEAVDEAMSKKKRVMSFMSHDPEAGQRILAMGKKEREEKKAFKSGQSEINRLKRMGEEVEMFEAVDPVEARDILKKHGGADEDFHALPSEHKNSLHHLAYKFKHNPGKGASGSRARMFHAHLKRQAAKADKAQADVQKLTKEEHDYEYEMTRNQLTTASRSIERLMGMLKGEGNLEAWVQSKLTMAADYLDTVADYMESDKKTK